MKCGVSLGPFREFIVTPTREKVCGVDVLVTMLLLPCSKSLTVSMTQRRHEIWCLRWVIVSYKWFQTTLQIGPMLWKRNSGSIGPGPKKIFVRQKEKPPSISYVNVKE
ncbi:hypothetical protein JTB14_026863 [Gonioctena quinquepunctata]|nr:hypothetical protein JTB14_026863 [Gonioctena quinquepunctata]